MKRLFAAHPAILSLVVFAFIIDAVMVASTGGLWEDASFALGSVLVVAYFFGISLFLRFVVFRNRIHAGITWVATILICWGWFTLQVALDQSPYRPSFLFIMCLLAAFKTMRLERSEDEKNEVEQRLANDHFDANGSESDECEDHNDERPIIGKKEEPSPVITPPASPPSTKNTIVPVEVTNTSENQNSLRSLKQVLAIMAAIGCLIALWDMPNNYYKVLRFIVVAACGAIIWDIQKSTLRDPNKTWFTVGWGMLAVIFNPILPIDFDGDIWRWVNIFGASVFILVEAGKSAAIFLAIIATVILITIDYAKEQKQIAYEKAFNENMQRIRDEENKKKAEEQEKREKQWAEWEAERLKKKQIEAERYEKAKIEWQQKEEEKKKLDQEIAKSLQLEREKYLEAERKRKEREEKETRDFNARMEAYKKEQDAYHAKKYFTILGEVKNPGRYEFQSYLGEIKFLEAIDMAGGFTRKADTRVIFVKRPAGDTQNIIKVNVKELKKPFSYFNIKSGDIIEVSKK